MTIKSKLLSAPSFVLLTVLLLSTPISATEKSVKHLDLPEISTHEQAEKVFLETTRELESKTMLNAKELQEIHFITYSLEKAMEYFVNNASGDKQAMAKDLAEAVEEIHINSENNRKEKTLEKLERYFFLANEFSEAAPK